MNTYVFEELIKKNSDLVCLRMSAKLKHKQNRKRETFTVLLVSRVPSGHFCVQTKIYSANSIHRASASAFSIFMLQTLHEQEHVLVRTHTHTAHSALTTSGDDSHFMRIEFMKQSTPHQRKRLHLNKIFADFFFVCSFRKPSKPFNKTKSFCVKTYLTFESITKNIL